ncbi:MAG: DUF1565 domain-containing protein, partial [Desulfobacterales bacterium]|nr:DUF1565 domain-containing protein [Desulfobacterales bacterium]
MRPYNIMIITPVLICLFAFVPGVSADLFVDVHNTSGVEDGSSQRPTNTIQEAIDLAADAGETTIYVAAGEYAENIRVEGKTVHLLGGCAGGASADYAGGNGGDFTTRDPLTHISHIRGDGSAAAAALIDVDGGSLDGFRITGGTGSGDEYRVQGGGVHVYGGSPTISGNTIEN